MHIDDIKAAATLVRLIEIMERPGEFAISTSAAGVTVSGAFANKISETLIEMAYAELDRLGAVRSPVGQEIDQFRAYGPQKVGD